MPMIEAVLTLFQMQFKGVFADAVELQEPTFGEAPERLGAVTTQPSSWGINGWPMKSVAEGRKDGRFLLAKR